MLHLYPELAFFILVSTVPAAIFIWQKPFHVVSSASLLIACGCVLLSLSWVVDYSLHTLAIRSLADVFQVSTPHFMVILFGFIPGTVLIGLGFARWAQQAASLHREVSKREALEQELVRVNERLEQEVARAERADKAKADFLANMSHDLRTPLNAIMGFSELIHDEVFGKLGTTRYKEYIDAIHSSSRQLHDSISDILDFSKISTGQMKLRREKVTLRNLTTECLSILRPDADKKNIELEANFAADLTVSADRRMLFHVLLNLLSNAVKYTPAFGKVSLVVLQQTNGQPVLIIRDTGKGMSSEDIELATAPYNDADSLLARSHEGLALQLALVSKFVELHDGQLMIDSKTNFGTCVTIKLPAVAPSEGYSSSNIVSIA